MQGPSLHGPVSALNSALTRVAGVPPGSLPGLQEFAAIGAALGDIPVYRHEPPEMRATLGEVGPLWHPGGKR